MSLLERDALAERIAAVLLERQKIGDERRMREQAYQRRNAESALARHYRLRGRPVGQQVGGRTDHPESPPQPIGDVHSGKIAAVLPKMRTSLHFLPFLFAGIRRSARLPDEKKSTRCMKH